MKMFLASVILALLSQPVLGASVTEQLSPLLNRLKQAANDLSSDKQCLQNRDCQVIPIGGTACGNSEGFIVTSKLNPQLPKLPGILWMIVQIQNEIYSSTGEVSHCFAVIPPEARCQDQMCVFGSPR